MSIYTSCCLGQTQADTNGFSAAQVTNLILWHKEYLAQYDAVIDKESACGVSGTYYYTSYYLHGLASAVEATGDEAILQKLLHYADNMLAATTNVTGFQHWGPMDVYNRPGFLNTFQAGSGLARVAAVINKNPIFRVKYADKAAVYIQYLRHNLIDYWFNKETGKYKVTDWGWPWQAGQIPWLSPDWGGSGFYSIWNDKASHTGTMATLLYQATGDDYYREIATRIAQDFKAHLHPNGNAWIWDNDIPADKWTTESYDGTIHDTSHANREPMMMVFMRENDLVFGPDDVTRMAHTLTDVIWKGTSTAPYFVNYIDGSDGPFRTSSAGGVGNIYLGWVLTGKYSGPAHKVCYDTIAAVRLGKSVAQNTSSYAKISLTGHLLRNSAPQWAKPAPQTVGNNGPFELKLAATSPWGGPVSYTATNLPTGAFLENSALKWSPATNQTGPFTLDLGATDGLLQDWIRLKITVTNQSLVLGPLSTNEGTSVQPQGEGNSSTNTSLVSGSSSTNEGTSVQPQGEGNSSTNTSLVSGPSSTNQSLVSGPSSLVNRAPLAQEDAHATWSGVATDFLLPGSDPDNDPLTFEIVTPPQHGTLTSAFSLQPSAFLSYTSRADYQGTDTFTYRAFDGALYSPPATITITVTALSLTLVGLPMTSNQEPSTKNQEQSTSLNPSSVLGPSSEAGSQLPVGSNINSAFSLQPSAFLSTLEDTPLVITLSTGSAGILPAPLGNTGSAGILSAPLFIITKSPANGTLSGDPPNLIYTPNTNFFGDDSFQYTATAAGVESAPATITITVAPVNDAPDPIHWSFALPANTPFPILLPNTDPEQDPVTFEITAPPQHGTLTGALPNLTYQPAPDYTGPDQFTYQTSDGQLGTLNSIGLNVTNQSLVLSPLSTNQSLVLSPLSTNQSSVLSPLSTNQSLVLSSSSITNSSLGTKDQGLFPTTDQSSSPLSITNSPVTSNQGQGTKDQGQATISIASLATDNGRFRLRLQGQAGQKYMIQSSSNLIDWVDGAEETMRAAQQDWQDLTTPRAPRRFYRLKLVKNNF